MTENSPARRQPGGAKASSADEESLISLKDYQFVVNKDAAGLGFEPRSSGPGPDVLPLDDPALNSYIFSKSHQA